MAGKASSVGDEYMFSRNYRDSARLHLQHWIWRERTGYLLHPEVPTSAPDWTVADIGTGNAYWLLDLAQHVPSSWKLEGFDVSSINFPHPSNLPKNVSLHTLDAFGDLPHDLVGKFDVVHIRAFAAVVKEDNPGPLTANLVRLLKPGGYLQWDEFDTTTFSARTPDQDLSKHNVDTIIKVWHKFATKLNIMLRWMTVLDENLTRHGLEVLKHARFGPTDLLRKPVTENWMMALEEVGFIIIGRGGDAGSESSAEEYARLLDRAVIETQTGVSIWIDMQTVVSRKQGI